MICFCCFSLLQPKIMLRKSSLFGDLIFFFPLVLWWERIMRNWALLCTWVQVVQSYAGQLFSATVIVFQLMPLNTCINLKKNLFTDSCIVVCVMGML